ncbi:hypothetical protein [Aquimarina sp. 2201CG14-23]|nr:hypothetical protein [Aquimarina sp. 2201CG14-23]MDH7447513.1 hypothetical protein [Aquimarina sp. 2201CG14-23]
MELIYRSPELKEKGVDIIDKAINGLSEKEQKQLVSLLKKLLFTANKAI